MGFIKTILMLSPDRAVDWLERLLGSAGIVAYHGVTDVPFLPAVHITVAALAEQLDFLTAKYDVLPLSEFVARRRDGRSLNRCASITFDDAYAGILSLVLPLLEQRRLPATVFVVPEYTLPGRRYWWDRLEWIRIRADSETRLRSFLAVTKLPSPTNEQSYNAVAAEGTGRLDQDAEAVLADAESVVGPPPLRSLDEAGLLQLAQSELIDFGCHSLSHRTLPGLPLQEQRREIEASHRWIADRLPRTRRFIAYPYGLYDRGTLRAAREARMDAGFTMRGTAVPPRFTLLACPRIGLAGPNTVRSLRLRLSRAAIPFVLWRNEGWRMFTLRSAVS